MSAEANYALLKKVFHRYRASVKLVDELKNMENQYYTNLLEAQGADATPENVALFAETTEKVAQLGAGSGVCAWNPRSRCFHD